MADKRNDSPSILNLPQKFVSDGVTFPGYVRKDLKEAIEKFECRDDDVYVVTYPKSGTTWAIEMVSLILNNADTEYNLSLEQMARVPVLELRTEFAQRIKFFFLIIYRLIFWLLPKDAQKTMINYRATLMASDGMKYLNSVTSPRLIKSHLPCNFFPGEALKKKCKIVYVLRNPKDTYVSYYYFHKNNWFHGYYDKSWSEFYQACVDKQLPYGDWFDHVLGWWKHKDEKNFCFLKYEDMKRNPRAAVETLSSFLEKDLSEEETTKILEHCRFENMKKNPTVNMSLHTAVFDLRRGAFIRKGVVGDWESHFTVTENAAFQELYDKKMKGSGLTFDM
ncbi:sulfotransferase 1 family member D1-like isoform X1 [Ptychodera flava]|uniref:sulfotransferase 1 family member D1-like isoform X1 n=2 Tax=Ptychodera flava TaxID=63121 RepID=UPI00396A7773